LGLFISLFAAFRMRRWPTATWSGATSEHTKHYLHDKRFSSVKGHIPNNCNGKQNFTN
jgi:hypothetical protein